MTKTIQKIVHKFDKEISSQSQMNSSIKEICGIMRRDKAKGAMMYVPELSWLLFLRFLDLQEIENEKRLKAVGKSYTPIIQKPFRWRDWALKPDSSDLGSMRDKLSNSAPGSLINFINEKLFKELIKLGNNIDSTSIEKLISIIFSLKEKTVLKVDTNLFDIVDKINDLTNQKIDTKNMFPISQAYEGLLPKLGEKKGDGGQFFTPREIVKLIVEVVDPKKNKTIYDPCCGTGGFFIEIYKKILNQNLKPSEIEFLKTKTFWGREDSDDAIIMLLTNVLIHEISEPHIFHGNTLTLNADNDSLYQNAPQQFDYIFTNPPFGSKEGKASQSRFAYKTGKAQILFMQEIIDSLKDKGECGLVIDEGVMFHTKTRAFQQTKKKLLNECNLHTVISLPPNVFVNANAGSKTNLLFFKKGQPTEKIWFYDMTIDENFRERKINKGNPLLYDQFNDFLYRFNLKNNNKDKISERSWFVDIDEIIKSDYKINAINKNKPDLSDKRSYNSLLKSLQIRGKKISKLISKL